MQEYIVVLTMVFDRVTWYPAHGSNQHLVTFTNSLGKAQKFDAIEAAVVAAICREDPAVKSANVEPWAEPDDFLVMGEPR